MTKPDLLMAGRMMPMILEALTKRFTVHRLYDAPDRAAMLAAIGPTARFMATGNHVTTDAALLDKLPALKIIASFGVGYEAVDVVHAAKKGVVVTNTPDVLNEEVADTAMGLLLNVVREFPRAEAYLRAGGWLKTAYPLTGSLRDRKVGVLGLGRIGKAVARRLEAFGVPVVYHNRNPQPDVSYRYYDSLVAMARDVNVLMIVAPGGPSTQHIVNAEVLQALGPEGIVVNVGRGSVVDEKALIHALQNRIIQSAALDVFEDEPRVPAELIAMEQVVLFPHVGSGSVFTRRAMAQVVIDNLVAVLDGKAPLTPVAETPWRG